MKGNNPGAGALCVYDTDCVFCTKLARWASARTAVTFTGHADLRERGVDESEYEKYLVFAGETVERGHRAVAAVLKTMGLPWRVIGQIIDWAPVRPVADVVYRKVAESRSCTVNNRGPAGQC